VHIRLDIDPPGFSISIEDNGKGFEPGTTRKGGRGLGNMHQRLLDIGGRCEIQSNPGGGTKVIFAFVSPDLRKQ
jgi:signal transduction histidine kinase